MRPGSLGRPQAGVALVDMGQFDAWLGGYLHGLVVCVCGRDMATRAVTAAVAAQATAVAGVWACFHVQGRSSASLEAG
jgi:hypothetical protein